MKIERRPKKYSLQITTERHQRRRIPDGCANVLCNMRFLHCALSLAAQCIVIRPVYWFVGVFVILLPRSLEIACIDPHQTGFVGKGSDHRQLIKFWPSCAPGKGVCGGAIFLAPPLLQPARSVCVSERFLHFLFFSLFFSSTCRLSY